jgi:DNA polymerase-1
MAETTTIETTFDADGFSFTDAYLTLTLKPKFTSTGRLRPDRFGLTVMAGDSVLTAGIGDPSNQTLRNALEKQVDVEETRQALRSLLLYAAVHAGADTELWVSQINGERAFRAAQANAEAEEAAQAMRVAQIETAFAVGRPILDDKALLYRVGPVCQRLRLAGEAVTVRLIYLALTSRITGSPVNVTVKGNSSGGKSFTVGTVCKLMPSSAFFELSAMTAKALVYSNEDFRHKHLVIYEQHGGEDADYIIRTLQSEGVIKYWTVEKGLDGELHTREIVKPGPTGFISTTTRTSLNEENETRQWDLWIDESPRQTQFVAMMVAQGFNSGGASPDLDPWQAAQEWLGLAGATTANIQFSHWLAERMPDRPVRIRRDFGRLLTLIETSALLFQRQRVIEGDGRVRATVHDYANARELAGGVFATAAQGLPARTKQLFDTLVDLYRAKALLAGGERDAQVPVCVSVHEMMEVTELDKQTIHRRLRPAIQSGVLDNLEPRRGAEWKLVPHPGLVRASLQLPEPDELAGAFPELAGDIWVHPLTGEEKVFTVSPPPDDSVGPNPAAPEHDSGESRFEYPSKPEDETESQLNQTESKANQTAESRPSASAGPGSEPEQPNETEPIENDSVDSVDDSVKTHRTEANLNLNEPNSESNPANRIIEAEKSNKDFFNDAAGDAGNAGFPLYAPETPVIVIRDDAELAAILPTLQMQEVIGLDCETARAPTAPEGDPQKTALDPRQGRLRLIQFAIPGMNYVIDCAPADPRGLGPLFGTTKEESNDRRLPVFVGHNLKFDLQFLAAVGLAEALDAQLFDTMIADQLLTAGEAIGGHRLVDLAERYLGVTLNKALQTSDFSGNLTGEQIRYAATDAAVLLPLFERLTAALDKASLNRAMAIERAALPGLVWLEQTGVPFDAERFLGLSDRAVADRLRLLDRLNEEASRDIAEREDAFLARRATEDADRAATGKRARKPKPPPAFNWDSPPQVKELLRARGHPVSSTNAEALQRIAADEPLAGRILAYRDAGLRAAKYGVEFVGHVHPATGRLHADYIQIGSGATVAGRMSCRKPNLMGIPRDPAYRACFRAEPGRVLIKADYSQIELRLAAQISGDPAMIAAFRAGEDLHRKTAAALTMKRVDEVTEDDRQLAKAVNFGLIYGLGAEALRAKVWNEYHVSLTLEEAESFRKRFFATYPGLDKRQHQVPRGPTHTRTLAGRRRLHVAGFTQKLNTPVQGSGADLIKLALGYVRRHRNQAPSAAPVLCVHDEIVVECPAADAGDVAVWLKDQMLAAATVIMPDVPAEVEITIAQDWAGTPLEEKEDGNDRR